MLGASATVRMPRLPVARPTAIQGLRMPHREEVRSLSLPKNGLATIASREPTLVTSASRPGAASMPTRSLTFNARETNRGARNSREVPVYASMYRSTKLRPTRACSAGPGAGAARPPESLSV